MMHHALYICLISVLSILSSTSKGISIMANFIISRENKPTFDFAYEPRIKEFDYSSNIFKPDYDSIQVSERHESSLKIAPIADRENKPLTYVHLWKAGSPDDVLYKRAHSGFVGMRGKKDTEVLENGKKQLSGLSGRRGKKYPYEFRGKFVGVRGKKVPYTVPNNNIDPETLSKGLQTNQMMLILTEQDGSSSCEE